MPISEIEIEDTWFVAGMCGTGSNTLVAKDLFIPDHRILSFRHALNGDYLIGGIRVSDRIGGPLRRSFR